MANEEATLELKVAEGLIEDARKGVVRMDNDYLAKLGLMMGDCVSITGDKTAIGKVFTTNNDTYGKQIIQMDGIMRRNAGCAIGEVVKVEEVEIEPAISIVLAPLEDFSEWRPEDYNEIRRALTGVPFVAGNDLSLTLFGSQERGFKVTGTAPSGPVAISQETTIEIVQPELANARSRVTYEDIGGLRNEVKKIREIIELPLKYPDVFHQLGIEAPKGILLYGPPGTGKTLIARAVAAETKAHFINVNGPEIMHKYYGESEAKLRQIFLEARRNTPSIIFLDEIDSLAPKRSDVQGEVEKRVVAQLLSLMDGLEDRGQVVVIGATNMPRLIDPALRRPGRFDREIAILPPDAKGRLEVLKIHTRSMPLAQDVDLEKIANVTYGFVGADIASLCKETGMIALRKVLPQIEENSGELPHFEVHQEDFINALKEVQPSATREYYSEIPDVDWDDIGGLTDIKETLTTLIELPLSNPEDSERFHVTMPKGILLTGKSGTGKTLVAKAVGRSTGINFITVNAPAIISQWQGEAEKALHDLFVKARQIAPCILFFDELDGLFRSRSEGSGTNDRLINQLVTEFDSMNKEFGVTVLAATNRPDLIESTLIRGGRFEYVFELPLPNENDRVEIFKIQCRDLPITDDVDFEKLAKQTEGSTGADIASLCSRASFLALRKRLHDNKPVEINQAMFEEALEQKGDSLVFEKEN
ncbi:MAG: CDC48 family AAA ATPase [Coriobacteriales bacterium]